MKIQAGQAIKKAHCHSKTTLNDGKVLLKSQSNSSSIKEPNSSVVKNLENICLKRAYTYSEDTVQFDTLRKVPHLNPVYDSEKTINPYLAENTKGHREESADPRTENANRSQKEDLPSNLPSNLPLRVKFAELLPEIYAIEFNSEEKILLHLQGLLDEHLIFLKQNRNRQKGEWFRKIRKSLIESSGTTLDITHIQQMLTIDPKLYNYQKDEQQDYGYDILINLPQGFTSQKRKEQFRKALFAYVNARKNDKIRKISLFEFPFQKKILRSVSSSQNKKKQTELLKAAPKIGQLHPFDVLKKGSNFKEKLYEIIREKEQNAKKAMEEQKLEQVKYGSVDLLKVADATMMIYLSKGVNNMFEVTLLEMLGKRLPYQDSGIKELLLLVEKETPQFLKRIQHSKGTILQIEKKQYNRARQTLLSRKDQ